MSDNLTPMFPPTATNLIPPSVDYEYFRDFKNHPFEPLAKEFSTVNASWLADASMLAYGDEEAFVKPRLKDSAFAVPQAPNSLAIVGPTRGACCFILEADSFVIVAFRGTRIDRFPI